ncbi:membralin [Parasteatoda tepidariorum]|nr:membralin [Parasteatoda tepidariorum]XP_042900256.1 membralin [Parasteatoda tepidariorum]XP_042900257.1 membralin [Parasteatoda tepidariorum]XP_042900258.1 membralin [Parasteatoda tepidariorum]
MPNQLHPAERLLMDMDSLPLNRDQFHNNNNNQNTLWIVRDRLFQVLFEKMTVAYASTFGETLRKLIEIISLALALISLLILFYVHFAFVKLPITCLDNETMTWSREGVLRLKISLEEPVSVPVDVSKYCNKTPVKSSARKAIQEQSHAILLAQSKRQAEYASKAANNNENDAEDNILDAEKSPEFINRTGPFKDSVFDPDCLSPITTTLTESEIYTSIDHVEEKYLLEYSLEFGFLKLSPATRTKMGVEVHTVVLDPLKDKCFGNEFSRFMLQYLDYHDFLLGSLRHLVEKDSAKGYVRNVVTGAHYRFIDYNVSWASYLNSLVVMIVCTLAVSMLLRYSHHQIFLFVVELFHTLELNASLNFPITQIFTVVLALVGMEAIMSEYFNDANSAFYIIILIWIADQYDTICCRTSVSKRHWLRFFYLYHYAFYAYHDRFNGQYSSLAFITSCLFIQHSMIYFFHRYELPAVMLAYEQEMDYDSDGSYHSENYVMRPHDESHQRPAVQHQEQSVANVQSSTPAAVPDDSASPSSNRNSGSNSVSANRNRRRGGSKHQRHPPTVDRSPQVS